MNVEDRDPADHLHMIGRGGGKSHEIVQRSVVHALAGKTVLIWVFSAQEGERLRHEIRKYLPHTMPFPDTTPPDESELPLVRRYGWRDAVQAYSRIHTATFEPHSSSTIRGLQPDKIYVDNLDIMLRHMFGNYSFAPIDYFMTPIPYTVTPTFSEEIL